ncbi:MAG: hypothetical protein ABF479_15800 [Gluconacetobacter sp.]
MSRAFNQFRQRASVRVAACLCGALFAVSTPVHADDGCSQVVKAAQDGLNATLAADNQTIRQPKDIRQFTCLGNFFNGVGLNVLTKGIDIASIAEAAAGKFCSALTDTWTSMIGTVQCGLSVTGFNANFGANLGGGTICPVINVGGGGDTLVSAGTNPSGASSWDVTGVSQLPDGYSLSLIGNATGAGWSNQ